MGWFNKAKSLTTSIGTKIILPYLLLTLAVAAAGAFIVTNLVTSSLQERFYNQLLDAGRIVSEGMVGYEETRLETLRTVTGTQGVPEALQSGDADSLEALVPQIIANSPTDAVALIGLDGQAVFGWQRAPNIDTADGEPLRGGDYSTFENITLILSGFSDEQGEKRVLISDTPHGPMIFTAGPVYQNDELVGAAMVGTYVGEMLDELTDTAVAHVTLYQSDGAALDTTLGGGQEGVAADIRQSPEKYQEVLGDLQETDNRYTVVAQTAEDSVSLSEEQVMGQTYALAFGDWRLRNQSFGMFSVALPTNFITNAASTSRWQLSVLFALATAIVFAMGLFIARLIIHPLNQLVQTALAVAQGNLNQRTHIHRSDEIGTLAESFDVMTENLEERNQMLVAQASELSAILNSIADGVIVLNLAGDMVTRNPAAEQILADISEDLKETMLAELPQTITADAAAQQASPQRYRVGNRTFSGLAAPMQTPDGERLGTVIALRDITREAEAENLQDGFITSVSHELRTPLSAVTGYTNLLLHMGQDSMEEKHLEILQTVYTNANHLVFHINKLIDISEIQSGTLELAEDEINFADLVEQAAEAWRAEAKTRELTLSIDIAQADIPVFGDEARLRWAIDNLLGNACNYTPDGGITVRAFVENGEARLDVTDTGVGIVATDQPHLFTRFFRSNNNHEFTFNVDGVGLGLYITRSIAELHGGKAWAVSKVDEGSTFSVSLPLYTEDE